MRYRQIKNQRKVAKELNIRRQTVRKYIEMKNIKSESMFTSNRYSYFDSYSTLIKRRLDAGCSIKYIFEEIKVLDPNLKIKYGALSDYIRKYKKNLIITESSFKSMKSKKIVITSAQVKKYIFNWKLSEDKAKEIEAHLLKDNKFIILIKSFYKIFRNILSNHDTSSLKKSMKLKSKDSVINKFIKSIRKDYNSVINTTKYTYNNSQVEGQVGKVKRIKNEMYGRTDNIKLLRNKTVYQSVFFSHK